MKDNKNKIKEFISKGQTDKALELLVQHAKENESNIHDQAILLSGQYRQLQREKMLGLGQVSSEQRRIELAILELLQGHSPVPAQVASPKTMSSSASSQSGSNNGKLLLFGFLGLVGVGLLSWFFMGGEGDHSHSHVDDTVVVTTPEEGGASPENTPEEFDNSTTRIDVGSGTKPKSKGKESKNKSENVSAKVPNAKTTPESKVENPSIETPRTSAPVALPEVNGTNVTFLVFGQSPSSPHGYFRNIGNKRWVEEKPDGKTKFNYREDARDDFSVYLQDLKRDVKIRLDLNTKMVNYTEGNKAEVPLYKIHNPIEKINGKWAKKVIYMDGTGNAIGSFEKNDKTNKWQEKRLPSGEIAFEFEKEEHDEWSIYLYDASQKKKIALDLYQMQVKISMDDAEFENLYKIKSGY